MHKHEYWIRSWQTTRNSGILSNRKVSVDDIIKSEKFWDLNPFELI
jgi:hypothetical protein